MKTRFTIGIILLAVGVILIAGLWIWGSRANLPQEPGKIWVDRHLTQCGEEWQSWVYERNKDNENRQTNLILMDEGIREFYGNKHAIAIYDIQRETVRGEACTACSCLDNTKMFLQVADKDASKMLELGYSLY